VGARLEASHEQTHPSDNGNCPGILALLSGFFAFYTARLLYVTRGFTAIRPGGQGAYVGALVFPGE
jgi:hypothetical protein